VRQRKKPRSSNGWKAAVLLLLAALAASAFFAEKSIGPLLAGDVSGAYPTRIYSAPVRLRAGEPMSGLELSSRLARLRYVEVSSPTAPGAYRRKEESFQIFQRGFSNPLDHAPASLVTVELERGRIASVRSAGGSLPLVETSLEPELLYEISGEKRIRREKLSSSDIPRSVADALVAAEDRRFFSHFGVDPRGILRAAFKNVQKGRYAEGGSTLTQQLARSLFLTTRRTIGRKLKEAVIALWLDARFSKDEVLRMYLDTVYFGQDGPISILGLKAASRHYFDKKPAELSLGESALLVGLLRSPYRYDPLREPKAAAERRDLVLASMRREGFISQADERKACAEPVRAPASGRTGGKIPDYSVAFVHRQLERRHGDAALMTKGLSVFTTLDPYLQDLASRAVRKSRHQAALVALDAKSGAIRALVGGKDFLKEPFDRASLARRQPGSAFKPFVYAAALAAEPGGGRWTAASLLDDSPRRYATPEGTWAPRNYEGLYLGKVTLRTALARSLNLATLDLAEKIGPKALAEFAGRLGVSGPLRTELGLALGASEVTLLDLTGAYCAFANGGARVEPYAIEAAVGPDGEIFEFHAPSAKPVLTPEEAYLMSDLLRESVRSGTAKALAPRGLGETAGKTGTTNDGKDAWFIGYTPALVAGVWAGSDTPSKLGLTGAKDALPVWADFMAAASSGTALGSMPRPEGVVSVEVDPESGLRVKSGCPSRKVELFLAGTEPKGECQLHSSGLVGWFKRVFTTRKAPRGAGAKR
jgi:penicillin-binding protein 1B